jgi:hypothetical protein
MAYDGAHLDKSAGGVYSNTHANELVKRSRESSVTQQQAQQYCTATMN